MKIGASLLGISISIAKEKKDEKKKREDEKSGSKIGPSLEWVAALWPQMIVDSRGKLPAITVHSAR